MGGSDFHLERTDLDISQMLRKVCQQFRGRMEDKQMELRMDIQPAFHYAGDGRLMEKVFTNVIGNAVAYSPVGATVTVSLQNGVFFVENSGIHIDEEDLKQIFTPFYRVDKSRNRNSGGSGLGAVYYQDHLGSPWDTARHGEYGGWSAVYGVSCAERKCIAYRSGTSCAVSYTSLARFFKSSRSYKFLKTIFKPSHCME